MDSIRQQFDQILLDHLQRLLGTRSLEAGLHLDLMNISLVIFLAEQAANERDQMISEDDRYTRNTLYTELAEVGLGSEPEFNQAIEEMFNRAYIHQDDSDRLMAGEALVEMASLLDSVLPNMPGLNLIAYVAQTLDEAVSGRKTLEDAASQFDQMLALQGVALSGGQEPSSEKEPQRQPVEKKGDKSSLSTEATQGLIKAVRNEVERKSTRQSKVLSAESQIQFKTVAFGKAQAVQDPEPQDPQHGASGPDAVEEVQDPEPLEMGAKDMEDDVPFEPTLGGDSDVSVAESSTQENQDSEEPISENDQIEIGNAPDLNKETESVGPLPESDLSIEPTTDDKIRPGSGQSGENQQTHQDLFEHDEAKTDQLEPTDDSIEKEITKFEKDLAMQCPLCKSTRIVSELTTKGKEYYKCPNKSCNFISWGKPFHNECPRCHNPFLIEAQKNGAIVFKCPRATCNYWQGEAQKQGPTKPNIDAQIQTAKATSGVPKRRRRVVKRRVVRRKK